MKTLEILSLILKTKKKSVRAIYECPICHVIYLLLCRYKKHICVKHMYILARFEKTFKRKSDMNNHMQIHSDVIHICAPWLDFESFIWCLYLTGAQAWLSTFDIVVSKDLCRIIISRITTVTRWVSEEVGTLFMIITAYRNPYIQMCDSWNSEVRAEIIKKFLSRRSAFAVIWAHICRSFCASSAIKY